MKLRPLAYSAPFPLRSRPNFDADGNVVSGEVTVAATIVDAAAGVNANLLMIEVAHWVSEAEYQRLHPDGELEDWHHNWLPELLQHPRLANAIERSPNAVFDLAKLKPKHREAVRLYLAGQSLAAIARELQAPRETVRSWLELGMAALRSLGKILDQT